MHNRHLNAGCDAVLRRAPDHTALSRPALLFMLETLLSPPVALLDETSAGKVTEERLPVSVLEVLMLLRLRCLSASGSVVCGHRAACNAACS